MEKMKVKKYIYIPFVVILALSLIYSCSEDNSMTCKTENMQAKMITLSVLLNSPTQGESKSAANPDYDAESKIYNLTVLIFNSEGESEAGYCDGYKSISRTEEAVAGQAYDKEYKEINEIKDISLTVGKKDIYVIANAPDDYFQSVTNLNDFLSKYETLTTQGLVPHPGTVISDPNEQPPIGGIRPSDLKTNLTMCNYLQNVQFSDSETQHYLGYTTNNGRPEDVASTFGNSLTGTNPFIIERLVARVAIQKIEFDFKNPILELEGAEYPVSPDNYTYQIDSVFLMNVKDKSKLTTDAPLLSGNYSHGNTSAFNFLNHALRLNNLFPSSQQNNRLTEAIYTRNYDETVSDTPLWFYVFENEESSSYPTYFVIAVRYNFISAKDGQVKTVKHYYPVIINGPKTGKTADHDYIKRNYQYRIQAKIKALSNMSDYTPELMKASFPTNAIEVEEIVGHNLFPWTGYMH